MPYGRALQRLSRARPKRLFALLLPVTPTTANLVLTLSRSCGYARRRLTAPFLCCYKGCVMRHAFLTNVWSMNVAGLHPGAIP